MMIWICWYIICNITSSFTGKVTSYSQNIYRFGSKLGFVYQCGLLVLTFPLLLPPDLVAFCLALTSSFSFLSLFFLPFLFFFLFVCFMIWLFPPHDLTFSIVCDFECFSNTQAYSLVLLDSSLVIKLPRNIPSWQLSKYHQDMTVCICAVQFLDCGPCPLQVFWSPFH